MWTPLLPVSKENSERKISVIGFIEVIALLIFLFSFSALFSGLHRYLELLSHFRLQYAVISVLCSIAFLPFRRFKTALIMVVPVILNLLFILPLYVESQNGKSVNVKRQTRFRILLSNVHTSNSQYQRLIDLIHLEDPDILVLQEISTKWMEQLESVFEVYPHMKAEPRSDNFGIAVLSRIPFKEIEFLDLGPSDLPSVKAIFEIEGQRLTLIATHPLPPVNQVFYESRNEQLNDVAEEMRTMKGPRVVVGDLNITMWSSDYSILTSETGLRNARDGYGLLVSWPVFLPFMMIPIDHCLVSSDLSVDGIRTGERMGSDHLPLVIDLSFKQLF